MRVLDFANEPFPDFDAFAAFCRTAELPKPKRAAFLRTIRMQSALRAIFLAHAEQRRTNDDFDAFLQPALRALKVRNGKWILPDDPLLWLAWEAAQLLTSDAIAKLGRCDSVTCRFLFLDESRRGNRRWCDMAICGSRAKSRAYYRRKN